MATTGVKRKKATTEIKPQNETTEIKPKIETTEIKPKIETTEIKPKIETTVTRIEKIPLEDIISTLTKLDKELYELIPNYTYKEKYDYNKDLKFLLTHMELESKNDTLKQNVDNSEIRQKYSDIFQLPKFKVLGDRKYKKYLHILTEEYLQKLLLHEISNPFFTLEDFKNIKKWREFFDTKEKEYKMLKEDLIYDGTFEDYLQESAIITYEYLRHRYSDTKSRNQRRIDAQQKTNEINASAQQRINEINKINASAHQKLQTVMNGKSNQAITSYAAGVLNNILEEESQTKYEFKHQPTTQGNINEENENRGRGR